MSKAELDWDEVAYVQASKFRRHVVEELRAGPLTPSEIANRSGEEIAHISRSLGELRDRGIAELLVSEDVRKGRLYRLTEDGEVIGDYFAKRGE